MNLRREMRNADARGLVIVISLGCRLEKRGAVVRIF
jgi:hypothetical protein